uniref:Secreted protein n=1 Tax=Panagrellus redivivus TaxID=6233 RepID=A0A7E4ZQC7_PANRE
MVSVSSVISPKTVMLCLGCCLLLVPSINGHSRARAFYAITNQAEGGDLSGDSQPYEPMTIVQSSDPRCIFCRPGSTLGKRELTPKYAPRPPSMFYPFNRYD